LITPCSTVLPSAVSPRVTAVIGPIPDRAYWFTFACSFFM
jgi:hypothetical protein